MRKTKPSSDWSISVAAVEEEEEEWSNQEWRVRPIGWTRGRRPSEARDKECQLRLRRRRKPRWAGDGKECRFRTANGKRHDAISFI